MATKAWCPDEILNIDQSNLAYAIFILNRNILLKASKFQSLWNKGNSDWKQMRLHSCQIEIQSHHSISASIRVVVDGGANRWINFVANNYLSETIKPPDFLTGDLDSCLPSSRKKLEELGTKTIGTFDDSETDFTKSLYEMKHIMKEKNVTTVFINLMNEKLRQENFNPKQIKHVLTIMDHSGRIDHTLSNINTLFKAEIHLPDVDVFLMTKNSLAWLLSAGRHKMTIPQIFIDNSYWCSYAPIGNRTRVKTIGLKYDFGMCDSDRKRDNRMIDRIFFR